MNQLLDRILEWFSTAYRLLLPWFVLGDDRVGVCRRLGCYHRDLAPGWNWKLPLVEECLTASGALECAVTHEQTLTSSDGHPVTLRAVLSYRVRDARTWILRCGDAEGLLHDASSGALSRLVSERSSDDVLKGELILRDLKDVAARRAARWGIEVVDLSLVERVRTPCLRLLQR